MPVDLVVHVNTLPGGHVIATPVHLPDCVAEGDDEAAALQSVARAVSDADLTVAVRRELMLGSLVALAEIVADVRLDKAGDPLPLRLSAVTMATQTPHGEAFVALTPAASDVKVAGLVREDVLARLAQKAGKRLSKWDQETALAARLTGEVALRTLRLELKRPDRGGGAGGAAEKGFLAEVGEELTAKDGATGVDERGELVERVLATLALAERSSVMLAGPGDVGKTALIRELAARLRAGRVPPPLRDRELWRVTANELIAGAQYTGQWQERGRRLIAAARRRHAIVAMGDPVGIIDAGKWSQSDNNLGRMLRTYVESGEITLICEATPEQLAAAAKQEPSFVDAFHRVDIADPGPEVTHRILSGVARRTEAAHGVEVDPGALAAAVELTRRFEPYRGFPGKALRLLEEAVQAAVAAAEPRVDRERVVRTFTARTGLPLALLSDRVPLPPDEVEDHFQARVLGQPDAVRTMVDLVMVLKAALNAPGKPLGTFLFVGPTGVGKTELAKALAELLFGSRDRVVRFDMGEYTSGDAVYRLLGTAWRHDAEGELTRRVREQPFCVVLLDEIEKAEPLVFDALLSAIGEGRLTDAAGRTADFRNAIVIMTSNLGATGRDARPLGFNAGDDDGLRERRRRHYQEQVERFFRPEFVNRIDRVVVFDPLEEATVRRIVRRELGRLLMREGIVRRQLLVEVDEDAVEELAARGFHPRYGARPLQREIERMVIQPLARRIVERGGAPGDLVRVHVAAGRIAVDVRAVTTPAEPAPAPATPPAGAPGGVVRALKAVVALCRRLDEDAASPVGEAVRAELSALVERTQDPGFWDEPERARTTLARVYELQRIVDALAALRERADGLLEMGRLMRATRDRARLPELRRTIAELERRRELVRLELAGAAGGARDGEAVVHVAAVSDGADTSGWAGELLDMYAGWAERTGRTARPGRRASSLTIDGASSRELLAGECGLHRWAPNEGRPRLARVAVAGVEDEPALVVRVYDEGRNVVRDPRTGTQVRDVRRVLSGGIDDFLIAAVSR